jgi:hypothetical protein
MRSQISLIIALLSINSVAVAQTQDTQPAPELERLEYFVGKWRCQQPAAPEAPVGTFNWTVERDLNDFWYVGDAEEIKVPEARKPINSREFLGYDADSQQLFRFVVVGDGNSYSLTASNWQENKLTWSGSVIDRGKIRQLRQEIVRENEDKFSATYMILDGKGEWQPVVQESCDRR